ncbi:unnamed protein product [Sympodiomycopsis kandeliae]
MKLLNTSLATLAIFLALSLHNVDGAALETRATKCSKSTDCNVAKQHFCNHGYCSSAVAEGQACYKNQGCLSGLCFQGKCASSTSRPLGVACTASTQCQSSYCGQSTCRAPVANGQYCYKDAGCVSKKCDTKNKKCLAVSSGHTSPSASTTTTKAATTLTASTGTSAGTVTTKTASTATTTASTTTTYPVFTLPSSGAASPPAATAALARNGDFSDGSLSPFTAATSGSGSSASAKQVNGNYVADMKVAPGGSVSLKYPLTNEVARKMNPVKRQNPSHWQLSGVAMISSFTKAPGSEPYASCKVMGIIGEQTPVKLYEFVYEYAQQGAYGGWSRFSTKWATGPTEATIQLVCDPGMSGEFYTDNFAIGPFLHTYPNYSVGDGTFESGSYPSNMEFNQGDSGVTYAIKNDAGNAHSGTHYLEATVDGGWWDFGWVLDEHAPYVDHDADPEWQDYEWSFWYNIVSLEDTTGNTAVRDGCGFQAGDENNLQWFGTTKSGSDYMQVNDPALTLPSGWRKATIKSPVDNGYVGGSIGCRDWAKATIRIDDVTLIAPRNETAY